MTHCDLCGDPVYGFNRHPCCERMWNGRYCTSCEASKRFWRDQAR